MNYIVLMKFCHNIRKVFICFDESNICEFNSKNLVNDF